MAPIVGISLIKVVPPIGKQRRLSVCRQKELAERLKDGIGLYAGRTEEVPSDESEDRSGV